MYTSFNNEWVKTISKDEFVEHGLRVSDWSDIDLEAYYNEVVPNITLKDNIPDIVSIQVVVNKIQEPEKEIDQINTSQHGTISNEGKPDSNIQ